MVAAPGWLREFATRINPPTGKTGMNDLARTIADVSATLYAGALKKMPPDVEAALREAGEKERNEPARTIARTIVENIEVAAETDNIICQDTGTPVFLLRMGEAFPLPPARVVEAIRRGVSEGTKRHNLRPNIVHPLRRVNSGDNTGHRVPVIHFEFEGDDDRLDMLMIPKGSGSENQSFMKMLAPAAGERGIEEFVLNSVAEAGGMPCPPIIVGVGVGGTFDLAPQLAKTAVGRPVGSKNPDPDAARLEETLVKKINALGIGPMGLGGATTALAVHVELADTHISQLPVAVNIQCWAARRQGAAIRGDGRVDIE